MAKLKDATYTPGPWFVQSGEVCTEGKNGHIVYIASADRGEADTSPCERDRNVDLMAAAPEMLELLIAYRNNGGSDSLDRLAESLIRRAYGKDRP